MTRTELIRALARHIPALSAADAEACVLEILDNIARTLATGGRVEIRGFGTFSVRERLARTARNPKTGEALLIPAKWMPYFKPGKILARRINKRRKTYKLDELLAQVPPGTKWEEFDIGPPVGREIL
jgi:integration host factor subunit beta